MVCWLPRLWAKRDIFLLPNLNTIEKKIIKQEYFFRMTRRPKNNENSITKIENNLVS